MAQSQFGTASWLVNAVAGRRLEEEDLNDGAEEDAMGKGRPPPPPPPPHPSIGRTACARRFRILSALSIFCTCAILTKCKAFQVMPTTSNQRYKFDRQNFS